jgi:hypothetical protein
MNWKKLCTLRYVLAYIAVDSNSDAVLVAVCDGCSLCNAHVRNCSVLRCSWPY